MSGYVHTGISATVTKEQYRNVCRKCTNVNEHVNAGKIVVLNIHRPCDQYPKCAMLAHLDGYMGA